MRRHGPLLAAVAAAALLAACRQDMHDPPRLKPQGQSAFFADGRANRQLIPGTVARGRLFEDEHLHTGRVDGQLVTTFPFPVTADVMRRGQERFAIFCAPCHSPLGDGDGMIVQRGMKRPPSFHIERLQAAPHGHFFDVITNGFAAMYDYSDRITPEDRWAIVAYVRALQQSQNALVQELPASDRQHLTETE